jgi:hypothetical protein
MSRPVNGMSQIHKARGKNDTKKHAAKVLTGGNCLPAKKITNVTTIAEGSDGSCESQAAKTPGAE